MCAVHDDLIARADAAIERARRANAAKTARLGKAGSKKVEAAKEAARKEAAR